MRRRPAAALVLALLACAIGTAGAETHRVDDSASQVLSSTLRLRPTDSHAIRGVLSTRVSGEVEVLVRLDVSPWRNRQGRIYMTLPAGAADAAYAAQWTTRGRLLSGALRPGERALVYAGALPDALLEDTLRLHIEADGARLRGAEQLAFSFEIDLDPT